MLSNGHLRKWVHKVTLKACNRPFLSCFEPHYESETKCKDFVMKISFHSYANKTNFHMKSFALSLAFIVRFTATRKWPSGIFFPPSFVSYTGIGGLGA